MNEKNFFDLVEKYDGFEFVIAYADKVVYIGGKGNKCWYFMDKGVYDEYYVADLVEGKWTDWYYESKDGQISSKEAVPGTTAGFIRELAFEHQHNVRLNEAKISKIMVKGYELLHYDCDSYSFDVLSEYGVTVGNNDSRNPSASYKFWDVSIGDAVRMPNIR